MPSARSRRCSTLMRDYLDIEGPGGLGEGDLEELLLRIYPRKITVFDPADAEPTIPAARDFLAYLAERGEIPEGTARALERELDVIAPRFTEAMMDPSNWGMAGSLVHAMAADGVDLNDQAAVDRWINAYNAGLAGPGTRRKTRTTIRRPEGGLRPARPDGAAAAARTGGTGRDGPARSVDGPATQAGLVAGRGPCGHRGRGAEPALMPPKPLPSSALTLAPAAPVVAGPGRGIHRAGRGRDSRHPRRDRARLGRRRR